MNVRKRLQNEYSKTTIFIENVDYVKVKKGKTSAVTYMMNYQCFERLAMSSSGKKAEAVKMYFIKLREFIFENQYLINQSLNQKELLKKYDGFSSIYFFVVDERYPDIIKLGKSRLIITPFSLKNGTVI